MSKWILILILGIFLLIISFLYQYLAYSNLIDTTQWCGVLTSNGTTPCPPGVTPESQTNDFNLKANQILSITVLLGIIGIFTLVTALLHIKKERSEKHSV